MILLRRRLHCHSQCTHFIFGMAGRHLQCATLCSKIVSRIFYFADANILKWANVDHHPTHCESSIPMHSEEHAIAAECLVRSLFHLYDKLTKKKGKQKVPFRNTQTFSLYLGKYAILMRLPNFEKILSFGNKDLAKRVTSMTRSVRWSAEKV